MCEAVARSYGVDLYLMHTDDIGAGGDAIDCFGFVDATLHLSNGPELSVKPAVTRF